MRSIAKLLATIPLLVAFTPMTYAQFDSGGAPASAEETKPGGSNWLSRSSSYDLQPGEDPQNRIALLPKHLANDQKEFWTRPARFEKKDLRWAVPLAGISAGLVASDSWLSKQVPASQVQRSQHISNYGLYSLVAVDGAAFLLGQMTKNDHLRETGFLAGQAALNSAATSYAFKLAMQRPRPLEDNGHGTFFNDGNSFPSEHSAIAWSIAGVVAHEYPGPLTQLGAYGLATAVSLTRVTGKQHFPSDVVIGGALGWYFAAAGLPGTSRSRTRRRCVG